VLNKKKKTDLISMTNTFLINKKKTPLTNKDKEEIYLKKN
jgi:hypothetical protein